MTATIFTINVLLKSIYFSLIQSTLFIILFSLLHSPFHSQLSPNKCVHKGIVIQIFVIKLLMRDIIKSAYESV